MYDGGAWRRLCTKYDVRCTIVIIARVARGSRASAEECDGTCARVVRKRREAEALGSAYVRSTTYDVRCTIAKFARGARGGGAWRRLCTRYNTHDGPVQGARFSGR